MMQLCPIILLNFMFTEISYANELKSMLITKRDSNSVDFLRDNLSYSNHYKKGVYFKVPFYSPWSRWGKCHGGRRVRRRHCLRQEICGASLRIEVARCRKRHSQLRMRVMTARNYENGLGKNETLKMIIYEKRQLLSNDIQNKLRGFSPWTPWSLCSRKCTTVRRRYCRKRSICGRKVVRQSAYCYIEGTYCQNWIHSKLQLRKDPGEHAHSNNNSKKVFVTYPIKRKPTHVNEIGIGFKHGDSIPVPPTIYPEQSRVLSPASLECGRLGRYRGSSAARMKYRMREMVRIIGGRPSPPGKWPWQVVVLNRFKEAFCGGTLVSLRWVVTAAHCVRRRLYVRLGEHDLLIRGRGEVEMRVKEVVIHPRYDPDTVLNDVAMLRLPAPARPDLGHGVACLPQPYQVLPPHTACVILGWGKKRPSDAHGTRILHEAQVSTIQQGVCRRSYWQYAITDNMVCAGRGRRDSCAGDSGGPLLCRDHDMRYYLQGITSFGDGCGKRGKYGIYTRTAGYVSWIKEIMNIKYFD